LSNGFSFEEAIEIAFISKTLQPQNATASAQVPKVCLGRHEVWVRLIGRGLHEIHDCLLCETVSSASPSSLNRYRSGMSHGPCPLLAQSGHPGRRWSMSAFGGKAVIPYRLPNVR